MSDPQHHSNDVDSDETPEVEAQGIDPDMPSTDDDTDDDDIDDDIDVEDLP
ncbi:hypothetical protein RN51_02653 [Microbacterium oxydans]|uniref:Uncharacterized protein n=1 Tax=Microbacterium oxydans TaxID=82380 RepID=A0A0F0KMF7_9MICO|nr:hypothetical protein [Microbacterium oxydans]KJL20436.1 hypothetical protein RN51_02653 [Microbacterium oxydans]